MLTKSTTSIVEDATETLEYVVNPDDATLTWGTSNSSVATVSDGVVTAVAEGTAIISVIATKDGASAVDTCIVTVTAKSNAKKGK